MLQLFHNAHVGLDLGVWCGTDPLTFAGIALGLFGAALVGGFAHCAPMCGPFVLMQIAGQESDGLRLRRLGGVMLPLYHLGRLTTYAGLGAAAGSLGASLLSIMPFRWVAIALLALAALSFLLQGLGGVARWWPRLGDPWLAGPLARLARKLLQPARGLAGYRLGLVLGLLPCGFLYSALLAAAATGGALAGGLAMAAFALGTVPALAAVGLLGGAILQRWRPAAAALAAPILLFNAATLGSLALRLAV
ncbi:MAG: sulfite exporter TauE/SafE family protein [Alphaproteobacteria bacterium]|nr:sulfite exporter TauE/SafE family protein [Alphaproteobacteria bacterium]MBV8650319.1 sulfite exporter TauE/SafE family protein [Alphaproteobacteria bacterium]